MRGTSVSGGNMKRIAVVVLLSAAVFAQSSPKFNGQTWWNYVKVLGADDMEGRETGSAGERKAQAYVVEQLKNDGLQPAGSNGFLQPVQFRSKAIDESQSSMALLRDGKDEPLVLGDDAMFSARLD